MFGRGFASLTRKQVKVCLLWRVSGGAQRRWLSLVRLTGSYGLDGPLGCLPNTSFHVPNQWWRSKIHAENDCPEGKRLSQWDCGIATKARAKHDLETWLTLAMKMMVTSPGRRDSLGTTECALVYWQNLQSGNYTSKSFTGWKPPNDINKCGALIMQSNPWATLLSATQSCPGMGRHRELMECLWRARLKLATQALGLVLWLFF